MRAKLGRAWVKIARLSEENARANDHLAAW